MRITEFDIYKNLLMEKSGLVITPDKSYLLESRLGPIAKKWGYASLDSLTQALQAVPDKALINDIVEAMTTNETSFFRDQRPFETFKNFALPYYKEARKNQRRLKIWCAAASSGQEPYSLAMILDEKKTELSGWSFDIIGTDISTEIIERAKEGIYSQFEVQRGMPIQMLMNYFDQIEDKWKLKDNIRKMVRYDYFNLLEAMTGLGSFDIIFCRNVLIYFNEQTKADVLGRMAKIMADDAVLFLGGAETVMGITDAFKPIPGQRGLYTKPNSVHLQNPAASPLASSGVSA